MKNVYAIDLLNHIPNGTQIEFYGWVKTRRKQSKVIFLDVCDSTGKIQSVIDKTNKKMFELARRISKETAARLTQNPI